MRWLQVPVISALAFVFSGCSYQADYGSSKAATDTFHQRVDRGEYGAIYDSSASGYQKAANRDISNRFFARISRKMGTCADSPAAFSGYQVTTSGTFVSMISSRACKNGKLEEQFVWLIEAGKPLLLKYNANSPLLLVD
jgi:hypothetical protein